MNYSTLVVSATLNVAIGKNFGAKSGKNTPPGALARVLRKLRTKDKRPVYINLLKDSVIPEKINETIVKCLHDEKVFFRSDRGFRVLTSLARIIIYTIFYSSIPEGS